MESERLIAKYFQNQLSAEEKIQFEQLMNSNSEFKEQVLFEEKVKKSIFKQEHSKLKKQLELVEEGMKTKNHNFRRYLIAASIVILISVGFLWKFNSPTPEKLFESNYTIASNTTYPITRNSESKDLLSQAFIAYESNVFNDAEVLFTEAFAKTGNSELLFYKGVCNIELGLENKAIEIFLNHISFNDRLAGKSKWYLALCYLKTNNVEDSKKILKEISLSSDNYNFEKATKIYSKL